MESLGEFLKLERESRNISLEDISHKTRINVKILKAIEKDDKDNLPGVAFTRGFVKTYAKYIGIDETDVLMKFDQFYKKKDDITGYEREIVTDFFSEKKKKPFLYILLALVIIWFLYIMFSGGAKNKLETEKPAKKETKIILDKEPPVKDTTLKPEEEEEEVTAAVTTLPEETEETEEAEETEETEETEKPKEPTETKKVTSLKTEEPVKKKKVAKKPIIIADAKHKLIFRADGIVWMQIQIDDDDPYEVTMHAEEVYKVTAYDRFKVKIGDAGKVKLELDGEDLGYLGKEKQVKNVTLPEEKKEE